MRNSKFFYLALLGLPWISILFVGRESFKKYLPAALFMSTFTKSIDLFGEKKKWWRFYKGVPPLDSMNFFNFGPFLVTSIWMLKFTYGKFLKYLLSNAALHVVFIFLGGVKLADRFNIFTLDKLTKFQYLFIDLLRAFILYGYQFIVDLGRSKKVASNKTVH